MVNSRGSDDTEYLQGNQPCYSKASLLFTFFPSLDSLGRLQSSCPATSYDEPKAPWLRMGVSSVHSAVEHQERFRYQKAPQKNALTGSRTGGFSWWEETRSPLDRHRGVASSPCTRKEQHPSPCSLLCPAESCMISQRTTEWGHPLLAHPRGHIPRLPAGRSPAEIASGALGSALAPE